MCRSASGPLHGLAESLGALQKSLETASTDHRLKRRCVHLSAKAWGSTPRSKKCSAEVAPVLCNFDQKFTGRAKPGGGFRLHKFAADEIERLLCGPFAHPIAGSAEVAFERIGLLCVANCDVDQSHGLRIGCAGGSGDPGDAETKSRPRALAN